MIRTATQFLTFMQVQNTLLESAHNMDYALEHMQYSSWECAKCEGLSSGSLGASVNFLGVSMKLISTRAWRMGFCPRLQDSIKWHSP